MSATFWNLRRRQEAERRNIAATATEMEESQKEKAEKSDTAKKTRRKASGKPNKET